MKRLTLFSMGSLLAACASEPPPPAASSATIDAATDTPSASVTPVKTDIMRAAEADRRAENPAATPATASGATQPSTTGPAPAPRTAADVPAKSPTDRPEASGAVADNAVSTTTGSAPDNSRVNARDRSGDTLTPLDQGGSEADRKITQQVRQALMNDGSLSFTAKNVKIITVNGKVTLRGPVNTAQERATIEAAAKKIAGADRVENLLEPKK
ncbi:MAG TPA: BON domain-containing protein [Polyangiaceae bacterium]|jgi:hypothetical protein|nr:BON domain-containing protein [Polyangiaceae bacterium]